MRTWTWLDNHNDEKDDAETASEHDELLLEVVAEQCNKLMARWNQLEQMYELRKRREYESGESLDCGEYECEIAEERAQCEADERGLEGRDAREYVDRRRDEILDEFDKQRAQEIEKLLLEQQTIERMLDGLGARLKRPYEHWNEEERYMEFMENRTAYMDRYDY